VGSASLTALGTRWRAYRRGEGDLVLKHTMDDAFRTLKDKGIRSADIRKALLAQRVELVLTAHPTQAVRRTMLHKLTTCVPQPIHGPTPSHILSLSLCVCVC
jgi:phosphoenolpyruvate carboxylase